MKFVGIELPADVAKLVTDISEEEGTTTVTTRGFITFANGLVLCALKGEGASAAAGYFETAVLIGDRHGHPQEVTFPDTEFSYTAEQVLAHIRQLAAIEL